MSSPFRSKEFQKLREEWNERLRSDGFKDIEKADKKTGELKLSAWDSHYFQARYDVDMFLIKADYYLKAYQFLHLYKFKTQTDRHVWRMHSEGIGLRDIAKFLQGLGLKTNKDYVATILNRLKKVMREVTIECKSET